MPGAFLCLKKVKESCPNRPNLLVYAPRTDTVHTRSKSTHAEL